MRRKEGKGGKSWGRRERMRKGNGEKREEKGDQRVSRRKGRGQEGGGRGGDKKRKSERREVEGAWG